MSLDERRPQDWIAAALDGFFAREGRSMPAALKGVLAAQMALACAGIQGSVEIAPFQQILSVCDAQPIDGTGDSVIS